MDIQLPTDWIDFELLDTGDYMKLERWGQYVVARPEPRALWTRGQHDLWRTADATHTKEGWKFQSEAPTPWKISYKGIVFDLKPTDFKHTGVFPEQAVNWDWMRTKINKPLKVLNLFAYTGGSTMAAALAGANVTHVDASRPAMMWASANAKASGINPERIRWIQEDVMKFVQREIRRGAQYDAIIMDPPRFGRGAGGEMWKLELHLPKLVHECKKILSDEAAFLLVNAYTADLSHLAIRSVVEDAMKQLGGTIESGELGLKESGRERILPCGIWARWSK